MNEINDAENTTEETFLVTLDVNFLSTNIPNHEGIEAAREALNSVPKEPVATKVIIKTICAPNYADIVMGKFERNFTYPCL